MAASTDAPGRRPPLMPLAEALDRLLAAATPLERHERVATFDADGRVLAQDVVSALDVPGHDNSAMDGYALRCADAPAAGAELRVSQRVAAGYTAEPLSPGTVARIFTGAPVPAGADCVVMQEDTESLDGGARVRILTAPVRGQSVRPAGEDVARGAVLLRKGERLAPAALGLAAGIGIDRLLVAARPRVALFSTGDELVTPGEVPPEAMPPGAIYNSNRYFLRALLSRLGCEVTDMGVVPDEAAATRGALAAAAESHDLILTSGGVSVGEEDHVKPAVEALGHLALWQIAIKPGKPFAYGAVQRAQPAAGRQGSAGEGAAHFIGLPGNPVSSFVTFLLLVRPFVLRLQGMTHVAPVSIAARAASARAAGDKRREFLRARWTANGTLETFAHQGSGVLTSAHWADGLIDVPAGATFAAGDVVRFLPFAALGA